MKWWNSAFIFSPPTLFTLLSIRIHCKPFWVCFCFSLNVLRFESVCVVCFIVFAIWRHWQWGGKSTVARNQYPCIEFDKRRDKKHLNNNMYCKLNYLSLYWMLPISMSNVDSSKMVAVEDFALLWVSPISICFVLFLFFHMLFYLSICST